MVQSQIKLTPEVLIVGAGPVGIPLAIALKRQGRDVLLIEKKRPILKLFKGEYLQPAATEIIKKLNLHRVFEKSSSDRIKELRFRDLDPEGQPMHELVMKYPVGLTATSIAHFELIEALRAHAEEELQERFLTGVEAVPINEDQDDFFSSPEFSLNHPFHGPVTVKPQWVIGCDGRNSVVRKWMGGKKVPANAAVTVAAPNELIVGAEIDSPPPKPTCYEMFRSYGEGTLSSFSLGAHGQRLYFSHPDTLNTNAKTLRPKIRALVEQVKPLSDLGIVTDTSTISSFPAYTCWFATPTKGQFILAGDAANATTPYGGQGMTAGLEHMKFLSENFNFSSADNSEQLLAYEEMVNNTYKRISLLNFGLYYLFYSRVPAFKTLASHIFSTWERHEHLKSRVVWLFAGLDTDIPGANELVELWGLTPWQLKLPIMETARNLLANRVGSVR